MQYKGSVSNVNTASTGNAAKSGFPHILIAEHYAERIRAIRRAFENSGSEGGIEVVGTLGEFHRNCAQHPPDAAIVSLDLPGGQTLEILHSFPKPHTFPILLMAAPGGEALAREDLTTGALDYVVASPQTFADLPRAVERLLREWKLVIEGKRLEARLEAIEEDRKRAEAALRESEQRQYLLASCVADVLWIFDIETMRFTYISPSVHRLRGYTAEEAMAQPLEQMMTPESLALVKKMILEREIAFRALDPAAITQVHEVELTRKDDSPVWTEMVTTAFSNERGGISVVGVTRDITERKRAEVAQLRLATAVSQAAEAILITDPDGAILYANPAFTTITGYAHDEVIGRHSRILKSGKHEPAFYQQMWATLLRGEVWSGHLTNRRKDGTLFEEQATISPVRDSSGRTINYVAVKRDITREMLLEAEFRQAQKMDSIGRLAGGVAHDFNNLLSVILGNASFLADPQLSPADILESQQQIIQAAESAATLTRQLLIFSREQAMQPVPLDLDEAVGNALKMIQRILGEDISLVFNKGSQLPPIQADPGMIGQILLNLSVNSRDAMPNGGKLIISTGTDTLDPSQAAQIPGAVPGPHVHLTVTDTGCGIAPEHLSRIFEPFFTTKEAGKGTGLGLATVYGIVKQHGGWITVTSELNRGATFRVCFPADPTAAPVEKSDTDIFNLPRGTETILVVEDELAVRLMVESMLQRCGYRVLQASSGHAALEIWREHHETIHLLLTDLIMPDGMTGHDLVVRLQADYPDLKYIYTSGYAPDSINKRLKLVEGVNYLPKPIAMRKLAILLRKVLDQAAPLVTTQSNPVGRDSVEP